MVIGIIKRSEKSSVDARQPQVVPAQLESHASFPFRLPEASSPADAHRAHLAGRSSKELLCPPDSVPVNTYAAADTSWAPRIRKASKKLLAALQRQPQQQEIPLEATPASSADTETQSSAVSEPSWPVPKRELPANSFQELRVPALTEPDSVAHRSNSAAVARVPWAKMSGKSSRRLLPVVLESDSAPTSPAAHETNTTSAQMDTSSTTEAACSAGPEPCTTPTARGFWTKLVGRSSRKLLSGPAGEGAKAASHTKSQVNNLTTSSKASSSETSVKHMIKAIAGRSLQPDTVYNLGNSTNSSRAKAANKSLAGQSSKKLLSAAATESACDRNTAAARVSDMLNGRSSRRLLRRSTSNTKPDAAAATPSPAFSRQSSSAGRSNTLASNSSCRLLAAAAAGRQSQSDAASACGTSSASQASPTRNNKALLASTSTRKLLGVAALIQPDVPSVSADKATFLGDAVVHIQSTDVSSKTDKAASTTTVTDAESESEDHAEPPARAREGSIADISPLALLLSHAADKEVLLEAVSELQNLAASSSTCKLMIGQCSEIIQGLADLLNDSDEDLQEAATALIGNLSSGVPKNQDKLASNSALVDGLIEMLGSSSKAQMLEVPAKAAAVQATRAAVALWALAADNSVVQGSICARHPSGGRNVARHLYDMMLYPATGAYAAGLTWVLVAGNTENQAMFADVESVRRLLMLMVEGSEMEREYAAGALTCLLGGNEEAKRSASTMALGNWVQMLLLEGAGSTGARASMHEIVEMLGL